jgi:hypothetical protein
MAAQNLSNFHYGYAHLVRHWHEGSEKYAGGDALFTALDNGWEIEDTVVYEEHWSSGAQCVVVFQFHLTNGSDSMTMPVITNPFVQRILTDMDAKLVNSGKKKAVKKVH